jgi:hypothetical protein
VPGAGAANYPLRPERRIKEQQARSKILIPGSRPFLCSNNKSEAWTMGVEAPEIGRWYSSPDGSLFEVVATDDDDGTIEIQHFDGTLEESGPEEWLAMNVQAVEAPEDWSGSVDISSDDLPGRRNTPVRDWQSELEFIDDERSRITEIE